MSGFRLQGCVEIPWIWFVLVVLLVLVLDGSGDFEDEDDDENEADDTFGRFHTGFSGCALGDRTKLELRLLVVPGFQNVGRSGSLLPTANAENGAHGVTRPTEIRTRFGFRFA